MKRRSLFITILLLIFLNRGCTRPGPSEPSYEPSTMRIEYDYQAPENGFYQIRSCFRRLDGITASVFGDAGTNLHIWTDTLAPFEIDFPYYTQDSLIIKTMLDFFWGEYKTSDREYYLASVNALDENQGQVNKTLRATYKNWPYEPNVPPFHKWSFVFVDDMPIELYEGNYTKERYVIYAVIHELGHQRAGLTHPEDYEHYHNCDSCIMHTMNDKWEYEVLGILNNMELCWSPDISDTDNCRYWLGKQNQ